MSQEDQPTLLARIRALTARILDHQRRFDLPKGHKDRFETHGGALALQNMRRERGTLQGKLDPIRLIATGISCRDCLHFADVDEPLCWRGRFPLETKKARAGNCGPDALHFRPVAANA